jgi:hypothetical protein
MHGVEMEWKSFILKHIGRQAALISAGSPSATLGEQVGRIRTQRFEK